jgi:hypothetical protein
MKRLVALALVIALTSALTAQNQFEAASVKKVTNNDGWLTIAFAPERFEILMPAREIIRVAYGPRRFSQFG